MRKRKFNGSPGFGYVPVRKHTSKNAKSLNVRRVRHKLVKISLSGKIV